MEERLSLWLTVAKGESKTTGAGSTGVVYPQCAGSQAKFSKSVKEAKLNSLGLMRKGKHTRTHL